MIEMSSQIILFLLADITASGLYLRPVSGSRAEQSEYYTALKFTAK